MSLSLLDFLSLLKQAKTKEAMLENKKPYDFPTNKLVQEYDKYSEEDHEVWNILYSRQMK